MWGANPMHLAFHDVTVNERMKQQSTLRHNSSFDMNGKAF